MELVASAQPAARADADRGHAAVRRPDARADGRNRARAGAAAAAAPRAARDARRSRSCRHRRPRPRRRVQRARCCAARSRSCASSQAEGHEVRFYSSGKKGLDAPLPAAARSRSPGRVQRPARVRATPQSMAHARRRGRTSPARSTASSLVYNPFVSAARRRRVTVSEVLPSRRGARARGRDARERAHRARLLLRARAARRSSRGCCRSTSRPSSTARCSSRPPRSRARG